VKYVVVAGKDLVRLASRIENVLADEHEVETWTLEQLEARRKDLGAGQGLIVVGTALADKVGHDRVNVEYDEEGVKWGRVGNAAMVWAVPSNEPMMARMARIDRLHTQVSSEAKRRKEAAEANSGKSIGGRLARRFIRRDHQPDPRATMQISDGVQFTMDRVLWEKEYEVAVAMWLLEGFSRFHLDLLRAESKKALERLGRDPI
jgi:hypothetical protein